MASWYRDRLSDWDFSFCFRSIWRAERARMEYRRCGADLAIWGNVDAKWRWLSNISSWSGQHIFMTLTKAAYPETNLVQIVLP
jgi:hypothetical protein